MGNVIERFAFVDVPSSYNRNISHLTFVQRHEHWLSSVISYDIPVRYIYNNPDNPTILMCHGNAEDIGLYHLETLSEQFNANICVFDYAGYGLHTCKKPSEAECQKDVVAVYNWLLYELSIDQNKIVIMGRSLGSAVACHLAYYVRKDKKRPQKLILVSPLSSAVKVVSNYWVPVDKFMNYQLAPKIKCSTLILHGDNDEVVAHACGQELASKFKNLYEFYTLKGCGHNDIHTRDYNIQINKFLKS